MNVEQMLWVQGTGWNKKPSLSEAHIVFFFGGRDVLSTGIPFKELSAFYPKAHILGCSTGGEIYNADVSDNSVSVAAVEFSKTRLQTASIQIEDMHDSFNAGASLARQLNNADLSNVFILCDGTHVNGSELVRGLYDVLDEKVIVTGDLAGNGAHFRQTLVGLNGPLQEGLIAAVGFYGNALRVHYGSVGGWKPFGPERKITRSQGNILYELDGKPALDLYRKYLGEDAKMRPASALLFPLSIRSHQDSKDEMVRTILGMDDKENAMIFAGDVPTGYLAQLMHGEFSQLVDGATQAASLAMAEKSDHSLAILVSCIGRKLLLGEAISDETEAIAEVFEHKIPTIGFYSYGEICHQQFTGKCGLHNQTMTVTTLHEI